MEGNQGFQFCGGGMYPLGAVDLGTSATTEHPGVATVTRTESPAPVMQAQRQVFAPAAPLPSPRPANIVKLARGRIKEIRAELKRMKSLKRELDELQRLVAAAKTKPAATVRQIKSARTA